MCEKRVVDQYVNFSSTKAEKRFSKHKRTYSVTTGLFLVENRAGDLLLSVSRMVLLLYVSVLEKSTVQITT